MTARAGRWVNRSHRDPHPATMVTNQASVTSWAHSLPGGIGPWKRKDPIPVAMSPIPIHPSSRRRAMTMIPANDETERGQGIDRLAEEPDPNGLTIGGRPQNRP